MNTTDINNQSIILKYLINQALWDTVTWTQRSCVQRPEEPDYIAALVTRFTYSLYHILSATFPRKDFSVSGVYCHQKPIVDIGKRKKPELGDFLLVYVDKDDYGERIYNSLLLLAKMSDKTEAKIRPNDFHQLELYRHWPKFTYYKAGHLNYQMRDIFPKTICNGAQYLLIDSNAHIMDYVLDKNSYPMGCAFPDMWLRINNSFSDELIEFLKFKTGRMFDDINNINDDWSQMIWDLLRMAINIYSRRKNLGLNSFPRRNECIHLCLREIEDRSLIHSLSNQNIDESVYDENVGVSVLLIECLRDNRESEDNYQE